MIWGLRNSGVGAAERVAEMQAALPGRGADMVWTDGPVGLGCRHRADNSRVACPPRFDADSGLAVVASARLDGLAALCHALGIPRTRWAELPDCALILHAYARWGRECPKRLLGDYAFAVWDAKNCVLFCARDHIGARPLYYSSVAERFVFASDLNAVLAAPGVSDALDEPAVATRLTYGSRPFGARTFYRAVRRLPPGHTLTVERGAVRVERWWRPEDVSSAPPASDAEQAEAFLELYSEAVSDCVRGDRLVGVHLSGGLDSSSIAALAARELRHRGRAAPPAFSWHPPRGNGPLGADGAAEHDAIKAVCRREGLRVFYCSPGVRHVVAFLRRDVTRGADEGTLVHEDVVQRAASREGVEVLLSGWGGDEGISFNGRGYYPQLLRSGRLARLWLEVRARSRHPLTGLVVEAALPLVSPVAAGAMRRLRRGRRPFGKNVTYIHPAFARRTRLLPKEPHAPRAGVRRMQLFLLQHGHVSRRVEGWAENGARYGVEYRYPLLDRRVLEFALGLPPEQFRRGRWSRWLMRHALGPLLPPEICWNPSKRDPSRLEALRGASTEASAVVRRILRDPATRPSRSHYLDLPRLTEHLDAGMSFRPMWNALRFLDF